MRGQVVFKPLLGACALAVLVLLSGCDDKSQAERRGPISQSSGHSGLFDSVADSLDHMEQFDTQQILKQVCDRLNQWYQTEKPPVRWNRDPLAASLPKALADLPITQAIDIMQFRLPDAWMIQESVWLRDASNQARGDQFDDLAVAERLFDWIVRNIQLDSDADARALYPRGHRPYETLLVGRGTAIDRAWLFMLMARQQGLDVVLLGLADEQGAGVRPWLPVLVKDGELYLFDPALGLPIAGPGGQGVATLAQVVADEQILRSLDVEGYPYPIGAADLKHVVAFVEASPQNLSKRMALVESKLTGKRKIVLTSPGSALAGRVKVIPHVSEVRLWPRPFEVWLLQANLNEHELQAAARELLVFQALPKLQKARALSFKGGFDGVRGAKKILLDLRPPDSYIEDYKFPPEIAERIPRSQLSQAEASQSYLLLQAKQDATYWLGLIHFEQGNYADAIDFFSKRIVEVARASPWSPGARYNLARAYEASGERAKAIEIYTADDKSPQAAGNQLRAKMLKEQVDTAAK